MTGGGLRKRRRPDPSLPRATVRDTGISFRSLGILLWIMDKPDGWSIRADQMAKDGKLPSGKNAAGREHRREGREAIRTALLDDLAEGGYYRLERRRMRDGSIKMGTAASEDAVESWALQRALFGRNAVPMVEQLDGTFLVQYPDGTLGPDDCDPPELVPTDSDHDDETAGHTGDGFLDTGDVDPAGGAGLPAPRNPAPAEPAPAIPASGKPASDNTSPLVKEEEVKGFEVKEDPPTPQLGSDAAGTDPDGGGENPAKTDPTVAEVVGWFARLRPDWRTEVIAETLTTAVAQGFGDLRTVFAALRELAEGKHGDTSSPRRLLYAEGRWWASVRPKRSGKAAAELAAEPKCRKPGHISQPVDGCALCLGEALACPECPRTAKSCEHGVAEEASELDPDAAVRAADRTARFLAGRQRRVAPVAAEAS